MFYAILFTLCLGVSAGYFLAGVLHWRSYRDTLDCLEAERAELDAERQALHVAWNATEPPRTGIAWDLGGHKRVPLVSR